MSRPSKSTSKSTVSANTASPHVSASRASQQTQTAPKPPEREPLKVKERTYKSFRLQKPVPKTKLASLPNGWQLLRGAVLVLAPQWKTFVGIAVLYFILSGLVARGFSESSNFLDVKATLSSAEGLFGQLGAAISLVAYLMGTTSNSEGQLTGVYQFTLLLITSLAIIWTLRQTYAKVTVRVRDAFYKGMYPIIPFFMLLLLAFIQLGPVALGLLFYNIVSANGIAGSGVELFLWALLSFSMTVLTLYMLSTTAIALYIVCLPDMTPIAALRSARDLVWRQRLSVIRKVVFLVFASLATMTLVLLPIILTVPVLAPFVYAALSVGVLIVAHSFMYRMYRELLYET